MAGARRVRPEVGAGPTTVMAANPQGAAGIDEGDGTIAVAKDAKHRAGNLFTRVARANDKHPLALACADHRICHTNSIDEPGTDGLDIKRHCARRNPKRRLHPNALRVLRERGQLDNTLILFGNEDGVCWDVHEGGAMPVQLHDGSKIVFRKVDNDYDPTSRAYASADLLVRQ